MQKEIFGDTEGDKYYERNKLKHDGMVSTDEDPIVQGIVHMGLSPKSILEIGCSDGWRLDRLYNMYPSTCFGIDPSEKAVQEGRDKWPQLKLIKGTADELPYKNKLFDMIIFGFCLYLCDRNDLFKIAYEADRALMDTGHVVIYDFHPSFPYKNHYTHYQGLSSYKMNYSLLFLWNPSYKLKYQKVLFHPPLKEGTDDDVVSVIIIEKNSIGAFPDNPYRKT